MDNNIDTTSKLIKMIITSQLLSIIFVFVGRVHINLLEAYKNLLANPVTLTLSIIFFTMFCIIISILLLNESMINIILVSVSYIIYWLAFGSKIFLFHSNTDPNDFGVGIVGLSTEIFIGFLQYIIIITSTIIATSIHKTNNALKNRD